MRRQLLCVFVCSALVTPTAWADEPLPPPRYSLKQDTADTGTNIKRSVVERSAIPLNRRYEQLTADERALVKSQYESMAADDEPPFPAYGLAPIYKAIADAQQNLLARGPLTLFVNVDAQGVAQSVSVIASPDARMAAAAAQALMRHPYKPARCAGQPCAMDYPFRMDLVVD